MATKKKTTKKKKADDGITDVLMCPELSTTIPRVGFDTPAIAVHPCIGPVCARYRKDGARGYCGPAGKPQGS